MSVISNLEYLQRLYEIDDYEWLLTSIAIKLKNISNHLILHLYLLKS